MTNICHLSTSEILISPDGLHIQKHDLENGQTIYESENNKKIEKIAVNSEETIMFVL